MSKKSYRIDKNNRLIVRVGKETFIPRGRFTIGPTNNLVFFVREPAHARARFDLPEKIDLEGSWRLDADHDLIFTLKKTKNQQKEELFFKTELLDTRSDALIVTLATKEENNAQTIRLMQLKGKWQASVHNRLIFVIQRSGTVRDVLIFEGAWEINDTHTLTYTYEKAYGVRAVRIKKTISFKGFWQIWEKNRLSYILDIRKDSYFNFKVAFQTPSILAKKGEIRYRVGIGVRGSRSFREKTFILYGTWNVSRDFGFSFEIDYGKSRLTRMHFGARVRSAGKNEIEFQLTTREGNDIGFAVMVSRRFLSNNAQWFVRLMKRAQETALQGGVLVRF